MGQVASDSVPRTKDLQKRRWVLIHLTSLMMWLSTSRKWSRRSPEMERRQLKSLPKTTANNCHLSSHTSSSTYISKCFQQHQFLSFYGDKLHLLQSHYRNSSLVLFGRKLQIEVILVNHLSSCLTCRSCRYSIWAYWSHLCTHSASQWHHKGREEFFSWTEGKE